MNDTTQINYERIEKAIRFLTANFRTQPSLERVAREIHLSPFHFQRIFLDWVGITPKKFLQYLSVNFLKEKIAETKNMMAAADLAGFASQSGVYDLFVHMEGMTPQEYKSHGKGLTIQYGYHSSPFGMVFIAVANRGICELHFVQQDRMKDLLNEFSGRWSQARIVHKPAVTRSYIDAMFQTGHDKPVQWLLQNTPFQLKVWEALINIPSYNISRKNDEAEKFLRGRVRSQWLTDRTMAGAADWKKKSLAIA